VALAKHWGVDETDAARAGILHDITKAIDAANLHWEGQGQEGEGPREGTVEFEVKLTGEAVAAAMADGNITQHEIEAIQLYVHEHFDPAVDEAVGLIKGGWDAVLRQMNTPEGTGADVKPQTERQVLEWSAMTLWVRKTMTRDWKTAASEAGDLWTSLLETAGSPGQVSTDLQQSYDEAKASGTNGTWNAMYKWVLDVCGGDEELAEAKARIDRTGCEILGAVLNEVDLDALSSKKYYNKSYYNHYHSDYYKPVSASTERRKEAYRPSDERRKSARRDASRK
jgi:hypothetical protein